jgi:3-isopropylmalate/(R)-2-methylmalate dehydratase small subunit
MEKFTQIKARAASLPITNVDTDMIIPKQFLKTIKRTGLGVNLFDEMRYDDNGNEIEGFVLNKPAYRNTKILIAGDNFGCGSSREHAPWSILDFGIKCIIAPSFADIFYNNCFKNGILPISMDEGNVAELHEIANDPENEVSVDLISQKIVAHDKEYNFEIDPFRKHCLLEGLDDIGLTLKETDKIDSYEAKMAERTPWLWGEA